VRTGYKPKEGVGRWLAVFGLSAGTVPIENRHLLAVDPRVISVDYDRPVKAVAYEATDHFTIQEVASLLGFENLWAQGGTGSGINVAVIDSGTNIPVVQAMGVVDESADDLYGHGSAVIDIIQRLAPEASVYSIKALDEWGTGRLSDIIAALGRAVEEIPRPLVVNMSLACPPTAFDSLSYACDIASGYHHVKIVAAAGNDGLPRLPSPARSPATVSVGALTTSWELAPYSNYGEGLDTVAPGDMFVNWGGAGYTPMSGTSFAAPVVSAMLADYLSLHLEEEPETVDPRRTVRLASVDLGDPGWDPQYGSGVASAAGLAAITDPPRLGAPHSGLILVILGSGALMAVLGFVMVVLQRRRRHA